MNGGGGGGSGGGKGIILLPEVISIGGRGESLLIGKWELVLLKKYINYHFKFSNLEFVSKPLSRKQKMICTLSQNEPQNEPILPTPYSGGSFSAETFSPVGSAVFSTFLPNPAVGLVVPCRTR